MRDVMLIIHFISIAIFVGSGFAAFVVTKIANKKEDQLALEIKKAVLPLVYVLKLGITLLILSGGYLMTPYWSVLGVMPLLTTKLVLVVLSLILIIVGSIYVKKIKKSNDTSYLPKYDKLQNLILIMGIVIVVLATLTFH